MVGDRPAAVPTVSAPTVLLLSTSDTDLITARASGAHYRWANPSRLVAGELDGPAGRGRCRGRAHPRRVPVLAGRHRRRGRRRGAGRRGQRRAGARRRADAPLHHPAGRGPAGTRVPRPGRRGQPAPAARVPVRHAADDRFRVRPAGGHADLGRAVDGPPSTPPARRSRCSTTAPSTWPATPPTSKPCARRSNRPAGARCRCTARRCAPPDAELLELLATADAMVTTVLAAGGAVPSTAVGRR